MKLSLLAFLIVSPATLAQVTVDGTITGDGYGAAASVQGTQTQFGDNMSELDAAYVTVDAGRLFLALTGNLEGNFNKLEIFIDSVPGGENVLSGMPGNDGSGVMAGFAFDAGFEADYHLIVRRGNAFGNDQFDVDISALGTLDFDSYIDVFGGTNEGMGATGTGMVNANPIDVAYDNSNVAGVMGGAGVADMTLALAVTTGLELGLDLTDIGSPTGDIQICAFVNGQNHDFASNQFLGPVPGPQGNLGSDGMGNFVGGQLAIDLTTFPGDQHFSLSGGPSLGTNYCLAVPNSTGLAAAISGAGSRSIADATLSLTAVDLPSSVTAIFYYGTGMGAIPFGDGFRCVLGQTQRLPINQANASGVLTEPAVFTQPMSLLLAPGTFFFQAWYRDPAAMMSGFNLSDGLEIAFVP